MTLEERWKLDIPDPKPLPYEKLSDEGKKEVDRLKARTKEERERDGKAFMKWVMDVQSGKADFQHSRINYDEIDDDKGE